MIKTFELESLGFKDHMYSIRWRIDAFPMKIP
jgi:hypothetical protein